LIFFNKVEKYDKILFMEENAKMTRKRPLKTIIFSAVLLLISFNACLGKNEEKTYNEEKSYNDENDFTVVVHDEKTVEITGYKGTSKDVRIPPQINGLLVTKIEDRAFYDNELTDVTIPDSVTYIGYSAFSGNKLTKVIIPNSITSIEGFAFAYNELTNITIPEGIVSIGYSAFKDNKLTEITIPKSVVSIYRDAFGHGIDRSHNNNITKITIGENVDMRDDSFHAFDYFYNESVRKRGGTYIFSNYHWSPQDKNIPVFSFRSNNKDRNFPDIKFLLDMPDLEQVTLSNNDLLTDITPLTGLTRLQYLDIHRCPNIKSFAPLSSLTNLETISIYNAPDKVSLALLSSLPNLKNIYLTHNNKYDYRAFVSMRQLERLGILFYDDTEIDISHIGQLRSLKGLSIEEGAEIKNINMLRNLVNLEKLEISHMSISDISWMSNLRNLTDLELLYCAINDVSPLANLPNLVNVVLRGTRVKDIAPLLNSNSIKYIMVFDVHVEAGISDDLRSMFVQKNINLHTPIPFKGH
jgi:hypothetical protein